MHLLVDVRRKSEPFSVEHADLHSFGRCIQAIESVPEEQKEAVARGAKMRTLGNIRLIAELFKKSVVPEKIVHMCVSDLTGDAKQEPSENNVEVCVCLSTINCGILTCMS